MKFNVIATAVSVLIASVTAAPFPIPAEEGVVGWADVIKKRTPAEDGVVGWADVIKKRTPAEDGVVGWADVIKRDSLVESKILTKRAPKRQSLQARSPFADWIVPAIVEKMEWGRWIEEMSTCGPY